MKCEEKKAPSSDDDTLIAVVITLGVAGGILLVVVVGYCVYRLVLSYRDALRAKAALLAQKKARIQDAANGITAVGFTVCFCPYTSFKRHERLIPHEKARQMGDLVFL